MLISPLSLIAVGKIQNNISTKEKPLGLISMNTKE